MARGGGNFLNGRMITLDFPELIGKWSQYRCPRCGHRSLVNAVDDEWCGSSDCTWMNDPEEEIWWVQMLNKHKVK